MPEMNENLALDALYAAENLEALRHHYDDWADRYDQEAAALAHRGGLTRIAGDPTRSERGA